jgi:hypothetical protein
MNWQEQCMELWDDRWKSTLARTVGVSKRSVQYWCSGQHEIKPSIIAKINETYNIWRSAKMDECLEKLKKTDNN